MKKILLLILTVASIAASGQTTRIRNLTTEPTYSGTLSIPCDKSTYSVHHKIFLSTIYDAFIEAAADRDTAISVFEAGGGTTSVQQVGASDTAYGSYSVAMNYNTEAGSAYSLAHGLNTYVADFRGARVYSSGSGYNRSQDGWAQCAEFTISGATATAAGTDTMLCGGADNLTLNSNFAYLVTIKVIGVAYDGADDGKTYIGIFTMMAKNVAGTTSIGTVDTLAYNVEAGVTAAVTFAADDTNDRLIISLTGTDGGNMFWFGEINMQAIKFD